MNVVGIVLRKTRGSVRVLVRIACVFCLAGLVSCTWGLVHPFPLSVIFSMSVGHLFCLAGYFFYLLAIAIDVGGSAWLARRARLELEISGEEGSDSRESRVEPPQVSTD